MFKQVLLRNLYGRHPITRQAERYKLTHHLAEYLSLACQAREGRYQNQGPSAHCDFGLRNLVVLKPVGWVAHEAKNLQVQGSQFVNEPNEHKLLLLARRHRKGGIDDPDAKRV